jgi:hypothetical protein
LAESQEDFANAEEFGNDWMPDDGEYTVSLTKLNKGVSAKDDKPMGWWKLTGQIEDVEDDNCGKEFTVGFYRTTAPGILKSAARVLNGGEAVEEIDIADKLLEASIGEVLKVKVATRDSKDGRSYTNCYLVEVLSAEEETEDDATDATEAPEESAEDGNAVADMPEGNAAADIEAAADAGKTKKK